MLFSLGVLWYIWNPLNIVFLKIICCSHWQRKVDEFQCHTLLAMAWRICFLPDCEFQQAFSLLLYHVQLKNKQSCISYGRKNRDLEWDGKSSSFRFSTWGRLLLPEPWHLKLWQQFRMSQGSKRIACETLGTEGHLCIGEDSVSYKHQSQLKMVYANEGICWQITAGTELKGSPLG